MNPFTHVAMRHNHGARLGKHAVAGDVIEVIVRVHDKSNRQLGGLANLFEQHLCGGRVFEGVDHRDAILANHESGIRSGLALAR